MDSYAPAAVLINRKHECIYLQGATDRFLMIAPGHAGHDLLAMAREGVRGKLRSAIHRGFQDHSRVLVPGGRTGPEPSGMSLNIVAEPLLSDGEEFLLICFLEEPKTSTGRARRASAADAPRAAELELELQTTRDELEGAIRTLEASSEEQMAINEEALSVNEEYQSTNEELLASKEELQSLNEELTALNSQLQETLERQRTTADDLQNVLYSTDVATIFLDTNFNIRFFTPATRSLFSILPGDVGRPLTDLNSLAADDALLPDAQIVLQGGTPQEREIEARGGEWYMRRILPYRTHAGAIEGVVVTFVDISERRATMHLQAAAKRQAELASVAKSRFLAAASHDLRQPLQTLALLQGLLARNVTGEKAQKLVSRIDEALGAMTGMLNKLLDINQIEVGAIHAEMATFPVNELFDRMREELQLHAHSQGLEFRVVPSGMFLHSDPRLLEQILRNLLSNALKYTLRGKVLLGCRRRAGALRIEVWDTGIGIPETELEAIFEEYHQLDNPARERSRGLGLGLSITDRLARLIGGQVRVRSLPGKGSVFSIEIKTLPESAAPSAIPSCIEEASTNKIARHENVVLVVEDDPEVRDMLELFLKDEGYKVATAINGAAALDLLAVGSGRPNLVLADYNLPNDMDGLQLAAQLRTRLRRDFPVVILTATFRRTRCATSRCMIAFN
jgi:two-component system, chemotaxis family, CheB/CheR fusion protein